MYVMHFHSIIKVHSRKIAILVSRLGLHVKVTTVMHLGLYLKKA